MNLPEFNPEVNKYKTVWGLWWATTWRIFGTYLMIMFLIGLAAKIFEFLYN